MIRDSLSLFAELLAIEVVPRFKALHLSGRHSMINRSVFYELENFLWCSVKEGSHNISKKYTMT